MKGKRFISILLCILMCVSMYPVQAFAEDGQEETAETVYTAAAGRGTALEDLSPEILFDLASNYLEASVRKDGSGYVDVTAHYSTASDSFSLFDSFLLLLSLPERAEVDLDSVEQNYTPAEDLTLEAGNRLIVPLEDREGYVRFSMRLPSSGTVQISSEITCEIGEQSFVRSLDTVPARVELFFAEAVYQGGTEVLFRGFAPAGAEIRIFYNNTELGNSVSGGDGIFNFTVSSADWAEGTVRTFRASVSAPGFNESRNLSVYRKADTPQLRAFRYYDHAGAETYTDLYGAIQSGLPATIAYQGNDEPFRFEIEYDNSAAISRLFVTASRGNDGIPYSVEAVRAEGEDGLFVAEGYFEGSNKHFTPDNIRLEYINSTDRTVDAGSLALEENGLYSAIKDSLPEVQVTPAETNTPENSTYIIEFPGNTNEDLAKTAIEYSIRVFDVATGLNLFDHYKNDLNYTCYIIPGLDGEEYYLSLDLTDPETLKVLFVDPIKEVDGAVEMIVDSYDQTDPIQGYFEWQNISETIGTVSTIVSTAADIYEIECDTAWLREQIDQSTTMTDAQKQEAHGLATELNGDRMAFLLLTTAMPIIVASGGMAAPVAMFGVMMAAMGTISDYFFEHRAASILGADVPNQGNSGGSTSFTGSDGLMYSVDYVLSDTTYQEKHWYDSLDWYYLETYYRVTLDLVNVQVSGTGPATVSTQSIWTTVKNSVTVPEGYSLSTGYIQRLSYQEGITGLPDSASNTRQLSIPSTATETFPDFSNAKQLKTAGPSMSYDIEFHWTDIPRNAFSESWLTSVMLPANCKSIGDGAFSNCRNLNSIFLNDGLENIGHLAFAGCTELTSVVFPATLTDCGSNPFSGSGVVYASFADGSTVIPDYLFADSSLRKIRLPDSLTEIGNSAFQGADLLTVEFPQEAEVTIGPGAFAECNSLRKVKLPKTVPQGGNWCFGSCPELKTAGPAGGDYNIEFRFETGIPAYLFSQSCLRSIVFPEGMTSIGDYAFEGAADLEDPDFPASIERIGKSSFSGCTSLQEIVFPASIKYIGERSFSGCTSLQELRIAKEASVLLGSYAFEDCTSLQKVLLPKTAAGYGDIFNNCSQLISAGPVGGNYDIELYPQEEISSGLLNYNCLRSIVIPEGVQSIGQQAFRYASALENLYLPDSLQSIGQEAFRDCQNLMLIRFPASPVQLPSSEPERVFAIYPAVRELVLSSAELETGRLFEYFPRLSRLRLENGVTAVEEIRLPALPKVYLPVSVSTFTFSGELTELHDLYFAGVEGQLSLVNDPGTVKIHYGATVSDWENNREIDLAAPLLSPEASETSVTLSWTAVEGAEKYCICRDNEPISVTNQTEYIDTAVYPGVEYTYTVRCLSADMRGSSGASVTVRVLCDKEIIESGKLGSAMYTVDIDGKATVYGSGSIWLPETEDSVSPLYGFGNYYDKPQLTALEIKEGITEVGGSFGGIFARNGSLQEVILPASLEHIGANAFEACYSIQTVRYAGSGEQWGAVRIEEGNEYLLEANAFYVNSTEPILKYTVVFDGNRFGSSYQDTWDMPAQKILYDVPTKLNSNLFTASSSDLAFNGWNTARDGSGDSYANEATVLNLAEAGESVTLYAQWRERTDRIQAYIKGTEQETYAEYHVDYGMPLRLEIETPEEYDSPLTCTWSIIPCDIENNEYYYDQEETVTGNERYLDLPSVTTDFIISCKVQTEFSYPVNLYFDIYCTGSAPVFGQASFTLPAGLTVIGDSAFEGDASITVVDAGHCVSIGANAFKGCTGLVKIRLPKSCAIDSTAFTGCGTVLVFAPAGGTTQDWADGQANIVFVEEA